jgi:hypothetical protein
MQSKEELEHWYTKKDPWQYTTTQDDLNRKQKLLNILNETNNGNLYDRALDIGAGEGFVTTDLPAKEIFGIEISDLAAQRFPSNVSRLIEPEGKFDLVMTTGTLYQQYDHAKMAEWIKNSASRHVLIAGIKTWLIPYTFGKIIYETEFSYREYAQKVTVYETSA